MKPVIIVKFEKDNVTWKSAGWGDDPKLMKKAKNAINKGENPGEVVDLLSKSFLVVEEIRW